MNEKIKGSSKNNQIQFLRFVFCILIMFYHYSIRFSQINSFNYFDNTSFINYFSEIGLMSFFILSGFFLISRKSFLSRKDVALYWLKRTLTIYVPYLIAILIIYAFSFLGLYGENRAVSFTTFLQNIVFANFFTRAGYVDGAHWYVVSLLILYVLGFVYDILKLKELKYGFLFWVFLLTLSLFAFAYEKFSSDNTILYRFALLIKLVLSNGYFPCVFAGICLFLIDYDSPLCIRNIILFVFAILCFVSIGLNNYICLFIFVGSLFLIIAALLKKIPFIEKIKPLIIIGDSSYSIYLIHQNIGFLLINIFMLFLNYYLALVLVMIIVLCLGVLFHFIVFNNTKKLICNIIRT